jgi:hypothetical protein
VSEAIYTLIGVVIGGLLNMAGLWWVEYRRDRRVALVAARLLIPDLSQVRDAVELAVVGGQWFYFVAPDTRWNDYSDELARAMKPDDWSVVAGVFTSVEIFDNERRVREDHDDGASPFGDDEFRRLTATKDLIGKALELLYEYGDTPPPPRELGIG